MVVPSVPCKADSRMVQRRMVNIIRHCFLLAIVHLLCSTSHNKLHVGAVTSFDIKGLGATFGAPLHRALSGPFNTFRIRESTATRDVELDYVTTGNNGLSKLAGMEMDSHEYSFYGTGDLPSADKLSINNLVGLPLAYGPIVIAYNLPQPPLTVFKPNSIVANPRLCLTQKMIADIFSGNIKKWDDVRLQTFTSNSKHILFDPPLKPFPVPSTAGLSATDVCSRSTTTTSTSTTPIPGAPTTTSKPTTTVPRPASLYINLQCRHGNKFLNNQGICGPYGSDYWNMYGPANTTDKEPPIYKGNPPAYTPPPVSVTDPPEVIGNGYQDYTGSLYNTIRIMVRGDSAVSTYILSRALAEFNPTLFGPLVSEGRKAFKAPFNIFPAPVFKPPEKQPDPLSSKLLPYPANFQKPKLVGNDLPIIGWLQKTKFSLAVVSLADAVKFGLSFALIENQSGYFVDANATTTAAAINALAQRVEAEKSAPPDSHWLMNDTMWSAYNMPGTLSYPILGKTYMVTRLQGHVATANMKVQENGYIWIDCHKQAELMYYYNWAATDPEATSIANTNGFQPIGSKGYALVEDQVLKTMQCGEASQDSVYDTFQAQLASELQIKQPTTMLAIYVVISSVGAVSLSVLTFRLARNVLEEIDDSSAHASGGGQKSTATQNFVIVVLAVLLTAVTAIVLTLATQTVSVDNRTHAFVVAIPCTIVVHFIIGGVLYWLNRQQRIGGMVYKLAYKIRPEEIRKFDVAPNRYRTWLQGKIIIHPDDVGQKLMIGQLRDRFVMLRQVDFWLHSLKPKTRQYLVRFVAWTKQEPPNIVWFYGVSEFERTRYIISSFCPIGDLATVLSMDDTINLDTLSKLSFASDIADGMQYLHGMDVVHASLKSCSCYVDTDWTVKVADWEYHTVYNLQAEFRQIEDVLREELGDDEMEKYFPWLYWTAPERIGAALRGFTIAPVKRSDSYSYGIILAEVFSRRKPYASISQAMNAPDVLKCIVHGARPLDDVPWLEDELPTGIIGLMQSCWHVRLLQRPTFDDIIDALESLRPPKKTIRNQFYSEDNKQKERVAKEKQFVQGLVNKVELVEKARRRKDANEYTIPLGILEQMLVNKQAIPAPSYFRDAHILGCALGTEFEQLFEKTDLHTGIQAVQKLSQVFESFCESAHDGFRVQTNGNMFLFLADLMPSKDSFDTLTTLSDNALEFLMSCWDIEPPIPWQQVGCAKFYVKMGMHSGHIVAGVHGSNPMQYSVIGAVEDGVRHLVNMSFAFRINLSPTTAHKISKLPRFIVQPAQEDIGQDAPVTFYWLRSKQYHDDEKTLSTIWAWTESYKSSPYGISMKEIATEYAGNNPLITSAAAAEAATGGAPPPNFRPLSNMKYSVKRTAAASAAGTTEYYAPIMPSVTPGRQISSSNVNLLTPSAMFAASHSGLGRRQLNPTMSGHARQL